MPLQRRAASGGGVVYGHEGGRADVGAAKRALQLLVAPLRNAIPGDSKGRSAEGSQGRVTRQPSASIGPTGAQRELSREAARRKQGWEG